MGPRIVMSQKDNPRQKPTLICSDHRSKMMLQEYTSFTPKDRIVFPADGCVQALLGFGDEE
jgi:hypothetical protein